MQDRETDTEFMLRVLKEGPATNIDLLRRSFAERGCGLTTGTRGSDVRRRIERDSDFTKTLVCERLGGKSTSGKPLFLYYIKLREAVV